MRQYRVGKAFCDRVVEAGGIEALNRVWGAPEALPGPSASWPIRTPGSRGWPLPRPPEPGPPFAELPRVTPPRERFTNMCSVLYFYRT